VPREGDVSELILKRENMNQKRNPNHPKKGDKTKASPIKDLSYVKAIIKNLAIKRRDRLLFIIGTNTWLKIGVLLELKVRDVKDLEIGDTYIFQESKEENGKSLVINLKIYKTLKKYFKEEKPKDEDFLFKSRKGEGPLERETVNGLIKEWTEGARLEGHYGCESLRKTFGYHQRMEYGVGLDVLCEKFNYSRPATLSKFLEIPEGKPVSILKNTIE
jgi:integrase